MPCSILYLPPLLQPCRDISINCRICKNYGGCPVEKEVDGRTWKLSSNGLNGIECDEYSPDWITPEQWEKRTGSVWPDNAAVYYRYSEAHLTYEGFYYDDFAGDWVIKKHSYVSGCNEEVQAYKSGRYQMVCATEAGPPPDDWRPEEEDDENRYGFG